MEEFFFTIGTFFESLWNTISQSTVFFVLKIFAAIYTATLLVNVILLIYLGDARKRYRQLRRGTGAVDVNTRKIRKTWMSIRARLESDDMDQWKLAVLEADHLIDKELAKQGYHGDNFAERLAQIPPYAFTSLDNVREAHELRNHIVHEDDYELSHEQAEKVVDTMHQFLEDLGVGMV